MAQYFNRAATTAFQLRDAIQSSHLTRNIFDFESPPKPMDMDEIQKELHGKHPLKGLKSLLYLALQSTDISSCISAVISLLGTRKDSAVILTSLTILKQHSIQDESLILLSLNSLQKMLTSSKFQTQYSDVLTKISVLDLVECWLQNHHSVISPLVNSLNSMMNPRTTNGLLLAASRHVELLYTLMEKNHHKLCGLLSRLFPSKIDLVDHFAIASNIVLVRNVLAFFARFALLERHYIINTIVISIKTLLDYDQIETIILSLDLEAQCASIDLFAFVKLYYWVLLFRILDCSKGVDKNTLKKLKNIQDIGIGITESLLYTQSYAVILHAFNYLQHFVASKLISPDRLINSLLAVRDCSIEYFQILKASKIVYSLAKYHTKLFLGYWPSFLANFKPDSLEIDKWRIKTLCLLVNNDSSVQILNEFQFLIKTDSKLLPTLLDCMDSVLRKCDKKSVFPILKATLELSFLTQSSDTLHSSANLVTRFLSDLEIEDQHTLIGILITRLKIYTKNKEDQISKVNIWACFFYNQTKNQNYIIRFWPLIISLLFIQHKKKSDNEKRQYITSSEQVWEQLLILAFKLGLVLKINTMDNTKKFGIKDEDFWTLNSLFFSGIWKYLAETVPNEYLKDGFDLLENIIGNDDLEYLLSFMNKVETNREIYNSEQTGGNLNWLVDVVSNDSFSKSFTLETHTVEKLSIRSRSSSSDSDREIDKNSETNGFIPAREPQKIQNVEEDKELVDFYQDVDVAQDSSSDNNSTSLSDTSEDSSESES